MSMNNEMIKFFDNSRISQYIGFEILPTTYISHGTFHFNNYVSCRINDFTFDVSREYFVLFYSYKCSICVDNILVYEDGWIHKVPKEMKMKIKETIKVIKEFNYKCKLNKVNKTYNQRLKEENLKEKKCKIKKFEDEKRKLIEKFK